jgi:DNA invertase Pin-like site-specific DNA recombinase
MLNTTAQASKYVIADYLRISQEDGVNIESNSIKNQREMIRQYISEQDDFQDATVIDYVDDGISGSRNDREAYQRLLSDVARGVVDCIIVKDLSRIGRDMLDVDDLLMNYLVLLNIRFIAINNGYDSFSHPLSNLELAVINLANQHYNEDLAMKSMSVKLVKQKRGEYLGQGPFGYKKSDTEKNKLVPDNEAAGYVRLIFSLASEGHSTVEIAQILNAQGIPSPSVYKTRNGWNNIWTQVIDPDYCFWTNGVIYRILKNEVYLGKAISNKNKVTKTGANHCEPRPRDEWIVIPDTHEPLVSESDFQKAQLILAKKKYYGKPEHIFGNKVKCPFCGHAMTRYTQQNPRFKCGTAKLSDHYGCQNHTILQSEMEKTVLASIRAFAAMMIDREQIKLSILEKEKTSAGKLEAKIREESKAIQLLESSVTKLFTSFASGKITKDAFLHKKGIVNDTTARKREMVGQMTERLKILNTGRAAVDDALSELTPLLTVETLDKEIVNLLIDKILVHGENNIEIVWNGRYET